MTEFIPLNVYGVSISHPKDWQIFINPNNKFTFNEGIIKIDKVMSKSNKNATSLTLRWAKMRDIINLKEYIDQLDKEFQRKAKKSRNKDKYEILNKKASKNIYGESVYLVHALISANHHVIRVFGKQEIINLLQVVMFSEKTKRMIIASLLSTPEEYEGNYEQFHYILRTLNENIVDYHSENYKFPLHS